MNWCVELFRALIQEESPISLNIDYFLQGEYLVSSIFKPEKKGGEFLIEHWILSF